MYKPWPVRPCPSCGEHFPKAKPQEVYCSLDCAIWPRIKKGEPDECWPWLGGLVMGYGAGTFQKRRYKVSRFVLEQKLGRPLRPKEQALHRCDNPACANPAHLFPGSARDNMLDKVSKGRWKGGALQPLKGEAHGMAILTEADVRFIWTNRHAMRQIEFRERFGVSKHVIHKVVNQITWKHVTETMK